LFRCWTGVYECGIFMSCSLSFFLASLHVISSKTIYLSFASSLIPLLSLFPQASTAAECMQDYRSLTFGDYASKELQFCRLSKNYDLTYGLFAKAPSWELINLPPCLVASERHNFHHYYLGEWITWCSPMFRRKLILPLF